MKGALYFMVPAALFAYASLSLAGPYKGTDGKPIGNISTYWTPETTNGLVSAVSFCISEIIPTKGFVSRHQRSWDYFLGKKGLESRGGKELRWRVFIASTNTETFIVGEWFPTDKKNFNGRKEKLELIGPDTIETSKGSEKVQRYEVKAIKKR